MRRSILVVDDEEMERELLYQIFQNDYNIIMAKDGKDAVTQLSRYYKEIVIILLDLIMPIVNGYQVLQVLKSNKAFQDIPIAMVTSSTDQSLEIACYTIGAMAVIHKPFVAQVVRKQVNNIIEMYQKSLELKDSLNEQAVRLNTFYDHLTDIISNLVEFRDMTSEMHVTHVKGITGLMIDGYMELFPDEQLTQHYRDVVVRTSAIHDIGKIAISDSVLLKPSALTAEECAVMQSHTTKGCEILRLLSSVQDDEDYKIAYNICRYHHERYDGSGYPDGLKGDDIPLCAQFVSIADVYDALVSKRVYKKAFSKKTACDMIMNGECGRFSPKIMQCFTHVVKKIEALYDGGR